MSNSRLSAMTGTGGNDKKTLGLGPPEAAVSALPACPVVQTSLYYPTSRAHTYR
jgi:hypothetical protein